MKVEALYHKALVVNFQKKFISKGFISYFKGAFLRLRKFLTIECPLKMIKSVFHFTLKAFFVIKIF